VADFLEPCLAVSVNYDRLSGYFSSRILALAAEGLGEFIAGSGKMRLIMSAHLTPDDFKKLTAYFENEIDYSHLFENYLDDVTKLSSALEKNHFEAMCWLLKEERLEIRIVAFEQSEEYGGDPIFHPKVGIFTDALGNGISFSGSVNETAAGWTGNIEEFKVFKSWGGESQEEYFKGDRDSFDFYWNGGASPNFITVPLAEALRDGLIEKAPTDRPGMKREVESSPAQEVPVLRNYQLTAIDAWIANGHKGILAMATGTGKTKTAKGCIEEVLALGSCLVVVTAPYQHIAKQWMDELNFLKPQMASGNNDWRSALATKETQKKLGWIKNVCVIAVQNTAASDNFTSTIERLSTQFENVLFVGDEVHGLGATAFQNAMQPFFNMRLGLSATPDRYFDEVGTDVLIQYFDKTVFQFLTSEALAWRDPETGARALCDYKYLPEFVELDDSELQQYEEFSAKIAKYSGRKLDKDEQKVLEGLLFKRAAVIKCAKSKVPKFEQLISETDIEIAHTLVYCFDMEQLFSVSEVLHKQGITFQKITGEESNSPEPRFNGLSERDWILKQFGLGITKILLAIKCLDEGVDVPQAKLAYILASSGNPREFIQRRGRLLRPSENKDFAILHDLVVLPRENQTSAVASILRKETSRILSLAKDALNYEEVIQLMLENGLEIEHEEEEN
jgi:superfamily II DNA or RNA helicase